MSCLVNVNMNIRKKCLVSETVFELGTTIIQNKFCQKLILRKNYISGLL
jgi:hypothetical protein